MSGAWLLFDHSQEQALSTQNRNFDVKRHLMKPELESTIIRNPLNLKHSYHNPTKTSLDKKINTNLSRLLKRKIDPISRQQWIAEAAFYKSKARGFSPGHEITDWLDAEQDYVEMLVEKFLVVAREDDTMTLTGLRQLAKAIGIPKLGKVDSKLDLIRLIQVASHHPPCFRTTSGELCEDQAGCQWNSECQKLVAEWCR